MADEKLVAFAKLDGYMAATAGRSTSEFRAALLALMPSPTSTPSASVAQWIRQNSTGSWPNPVRDANTNGRVYVALYDATRLPVYNDGLRVGDLLIANTGMRVATLVPSVGAATWMNVASGDGTPPPDPTPGDTSTPAATSRPFALLGSTGTWSSPVGVTLVQALSDGTTSTV